MCVWMFSTNGRKFYERKIELKCEHTYVKWNGGEGEIRKKNYEIMNGLRQFEWEKLAIPMNNHNDTNNFNTIPTNELI